MYPCFGGRVVGLSELPSLAIDRTDIDNSPEAVFNHGFDHCASHVEHPVQINPHQFIPLTVLHFAEGGIAGNTCDIGEDVDRAVAVAYFLGKLMTGRRITHVKGGEIDAIGHVLGLGAKGLELPVAMGQVCSNDLAALSGQMLADGGT